MNVDRLEWKSSMRAMQLEKTLQPYFLLEANGLSEWLILLNGWRKIVSWKTFNDVAAAATVGVIANLANKIQLVAGWLTASLLVRCLPIIVAVVVVVLFLFQSFFSFAFSFL